MRRSEHPARSASHAASLYPVASKTGRLGQRLRISEQAPRCECPQADEIDEDDNDLPIASEHAQGVGRIRSMGHLIPLLAASGCCDFCDP